MRKRAPVPSPAAPGEYAEVAHLCGALPSHEREGQIFWRLRMQIAWAHLRYVFTQARLRTALVIGLSLFFWIGLFVLFFKGFEFVVQQIEAWRPRIIAAGAVEN